jgi:hypothetical protein
MAMDTCLAERTTWTPADQEAFFAKLSRTQKRNRPGYVTVKQRHTRFVRLAERVGDRT